MKTNFKYKFHSTTKIVTGHPLPSTLLAISFICRPTARYFIMTCFSVVYSVYTYNNILKYIYYLDRILYNAV